MKPGLTVVGSLNIDIVVKCNLRPRPGETVLGMYHRFVPGGKGANQACAASLLGSEVSLIGCIGGDYLGRMVLDNLKEKRINIAGVQILKNTSTGAAFITIDEKGENSIILSVGANAELTPEIVNNNAHLIEHSDMVLVQLETPLPAVEKALEIATHYGKKIAINTAPALYIPENSVLWHSTLLFINEIEAEFYTGDPVKSTTDAFRAGSLLLDKGVELVVVTLGEKGSVAITHGLQKHVKAIQSEVVDTTAAGDTYIGGFCTQWLSSGDTQKAMEFASCAASISVSRFGAQTSIPNEDEVYSFMKTCVQ